MVGLPETISKQASRRSKELVFPLHVHDALSHAPYDASIGAPRCGGRHKGPVPTSLVLQRLHDEMPAGYFTLGWLMQSLHKRSFGIIMLLLALVAITPGLSIPAGVLLMIPAFQMFAGMPAPVFPRHIAAHALPERHLAAVVQRSVPLLRHLERVIHPRWHTPLEATKRLVGAVVVILSATLVFIPIPLSNIVPASVIVLISLAYIEEDGVLLSIALLAAAVVLILVTGAAWETITGAKWLIKLW